MPKIKTNRGAAKRFKRTATGQYRYRQAFKNHILTKKAPKRKLQLRGLSVVDEADKPLVKRLMPYN